MHKIPNPTNHLRRPEGRPFLLPSVGRVPFRPLSDPQTCPETRHPPIKPDPWSWPRIPTGCLHKQALRLRRERRQILGASVGRR